MSVLPQLRSYPPLVVTENANIFEEKVVDVQREENKSTIDELLSHIETEDNAAVLKSKKVATVPTADLSVWGVSEKALHSWDFCTPITETEKLEEKAPTEIATEDVAVETAEAATNTSSADFALAANPDYSVKVLLTNCRVINEYCASPTSPTPRKKIVVDKSCMVGEDLMEQRLEKTDALEKLAAVFPSIPKIYLREIYDRCNGDLNWSIDLLCDENSHNLVVPQDGLPDDEEEQEKEEKVQQKDEATDVEVIDLTPSPVTVETFTTQAEREELKRLLVEKVVIRDDFYSEHTLKLKSKASFDPSCQPSTSKIQKINTDAGNVIAVDSDVDMDDFDLESTSGSNSGSDPQEMMELNLGEAFVAELENKLQEPNLEYPKGFLPIVQVPVALARQLYALYIESVYQQMDAQNEVLDMLVKEDEEFAKKLQAQEAQPQPQPQSEPTTIPEIMQEQQQLNLCRKEVEQWKNLTPDDFAAKMTKRKLFETFPNIAEDVLVEIWQAHGNNYKETVESIIMSSGGEGTNVEAPISEEVVGEMREAYDQVKYFWNVFGFHFSCSAPLQLFFIGKGVILFVFSSNFR